MCCVVMCINDLNDFFLPPEEFLRSAHRICMILEQIGDLEDGVSTRPLRVRLVHYEVCHFPRFNFCCLCLQGGSAGC